MFEVAQFILIYHEDIDFYIRIKDAMRRAQSDVDEPKELHEKLQQNPAREPDCGKIKSTRARRLHTVFEYQNCAPCGFKRFSAVDTGN